jgi:hypothetical protein
MLLLLLLLLLLLSSLSYVRALTIYQAWARWASSRARPGSYGPVVLFNIYLFIQKVTTIIIKIKTAIVEFEIHIDFFEVFLQENFGKLFIFKTHKLKKCFFSLS